MEPLKTKPKVTVLELNPNMKSEEIRFGTTHKEVGERIIQEYGDKFRFVKGPEQFISYTGGKYTYDDWVTLKQMYGRVAATLLTEAQKKGEKAIRYASQLYNTNFRSNCFKWIKHNSDITVPYSEVDNYNYLLNCKNCVLDLKDGIIKRLDHSDKYLITKQINAEYDPAANDPKRFLQFFVSRLSPG